MNQADSSSKSWIFPEKAELLDTSLDQILATKIEVQYHGSVRIRCNITDKELIKELDNSVKER